MLNYEISVADLQRLRNEGLPVVLLDVREAWEVQTAAIEGSVNVPMGEVPARVHTELDPDDRIVVICHHGMRSLSVTAWLRREGFDHVQSLAGGLDQWSREIDPSVPRY